MLTVYQSNKAEWLATLLAEQLRIDPPYINESVDVIVNTWPTSRWLGEQLSITNGINALVRFPFPGSQLRRIVNDILDLDQNTGDPWKANKLFWSILEVLPEFLKEEEAESLNNWIKSQPYSTDHLNKSEWQLAKRIAKTFDEYILYRPALVHKWVTTGHEASRKAYKGLPIQMRWQPLLMKMLSEKTNVDPFCIQVHKAIERLKDEASQISRLPKHLYLFGISSLAPIQIELIQALSGSIQIKFFLLTPNPNLWQRIRSTREQTKDKLITPDTNFCLNSSSSLETALGRMGAEFQQLLEGTGEYQLGESKNESLFAMPINIAENQGKVPSLLEQLQQKLTGEKNTAPLHVPKNDNSLIFIKSPGQRRQVKIIRDQVLQWFANDESLQPRDILIMTPQVEVYAPLLTSVFNDISSIKVDIPWIVTDRSQENSAGLCRFILKLLDISCSRITANNIDELLSNPAIQSQQNIDQEEVSIISECLQKTGFRWGLDENDRDGEKEHSLIWCLDRWLLGIVLPSNEGLTSSGIAPYADGIVIKDLKKWWNILALLTNHLKSFRKARTSIEWIDLLKKVSEDLFGEGGEWIWEKQRLITALEDLRDLSSCYQRKLEGSLIKELLTEALSIDSGRFGHRSGKITISALEPMRAIPHRAIILMGINGGVFPRREERPSFNLLEQKRLLGDPCKKDQDRYVILEAIMSARDHLMISWNSRNEKTGESIEEATPIQQWLSYLQNELEEKSFKRIVKEPPASPLDQMNFDTSEGSQSISCDSRDLEARKWIDKNIRPNPLGLAIPLTWSLISNKKTNQLTNEILDSWLRKPQIVWLESQQLQPKEWFTPILDMDELELKEWQRYTLLKERLRKVIEEKVHLSSDSCLNDKNYWEEMLKGQGILPPGSAGHIENERLINRWDNLILTLNKFGSIQTKTIRNQNLIRNTVWAGDTHLIVDTGQLNYSLIMEGWLAHLQVCASGITFKKTTLLALKSSRHSSEKYEVALQWKWIGEKEATNILTNLKELAHHGLNECWPIPPKSGWAYVITQQKNPSKAIEAFHQSWVGNYKSKGERDKEEMRLCFGYKCESSLITENKTFDENINALYKPIINTICS